MLVGNGETLTGAAREEAARTERMIAAKERRIVGLAWRTRGRFLGGLWHLAEAFILSAELGFPRAWENEQDNK